MKHIYHITFYFILALGLSTGSLAQANVSNYSGITSVNEKSIKVYPNPATATITITADIDKVNHITINNIIGKQIRRVNGSADGRYDVSDLSKGVYIIRIFDKNDEMIKALRLSKV